MRKNKVKIDIMGLKDVKNEILEEAKTEANKIEKEAETEKEQIISEAEEKAEKIKQEAKKEAEEEKKAEKKKIISSAKMEARKNKLSAKQEKIEEVFQEFQEEITNLDQEEKTNFNEKAVEDAEFEVGKILVSEEFQEPAENQKIETEEVENIQGFILVSENSERRRNYSMSNIVDSYRENYRKKVADKLFED
jgi:ATP synthase (E/31 kDa) subunit.